MLELIKELEAEKQANKQANKRWPEHVTEAELCKRGFASADVDRLVRKGLVTVGRTINSRYIRVVGREYPEMVGGLRFRR